MDRREKIKTLAGLCLIFALAFCFGQFAGRIVSMRDVAVSALELSGGRKAAGCECRL